MSTRIFSNSGDFGLDKVQKPTPQLLERNMRVNENRRNAKLPITKLLSEFHS